MGKQKERFLGTYKSFLNINNSDRILVFNWCLIYSFFPVLSTTDITEAYQVWDSSYAYIFFTVVISEVLNCLKLL